MMILNQFGLQGSREPVLSAQTFALEHLITIHCVTADLRWAMVELAVRSFISMLALAQGQFVLLARRTVGRQRPFHLGHHRC